MQVIVNGEPREVERDVTVGALLTELDLDRTACAVEVNQQLVPKSQHGTYAIQEGDHIELVTLVGGG